MFGVDAANKSFQRHFEFSSPLQPGAMHAVTGAINIATPNPLEAHQNIAVSLGAGFFHRVRELHCRSGRQAVDRADRPLVLRPIAGHEELSCVAKIDNTAPQPFQISFRAATGGIPAADKTDDELLRRHLNELQLYLATFAQDSCSPMPGETLNAPP